jgi:hypothetical protein
VAALRAIASLGGTPARENIHLEVQIPMRLTRSRFGRALGTLALITATAAGVAECALAHQTRGHGFRATRAHRHAPFDGYGIYESCSPSHAQTCLPDLSTMAAAGFKLVINYDQLYGDVVFQRAYLARAAAVGMKVIVPLKEAAFYDGENLRRVFPALARTCGCRSNRGFIAYVVKLFRHQRDVWGYYVGDEVDPGDHARMKSRLADVVHELDPRHPRLYIDSAGPSIAAWRGNSPFYDTAEVIGSDFYPVRLDPGSYPSIERTGQVAGGIQRFANAKHRDAAIVLQAFSYSNYGDPGALYPTAAQMGYMLSRTLANSHPRIVLWYSFYDTMSSDAPAVHWRDLAATIARHLPL